MDADQDELSDRYVIGRLLGRGGMGEVRIAQDTRLLRDVAVKSLIARDPESQARFLREAQITGKLTHPNIPPIHDLGVGPDGALFFTMQALAGRDLAEILKEDGRFRVGTGLALFAKLCDAVSYAHARGVLHRDLKPANVVVGEFGEVYVIDWGLAKPFDEEDADDDEDEEALTEAGEVIGTPSYMSPEHASGANLDPRSDIYSLGAILYTILTGEKPVKGQGYAALLQAAEGRFTPPRKVDPSIPWEVEQIILRAMALDRTRRYPHVPALLEDISAWQDGRLLPGIRYSAWRRARYNLSRYSSALAGIGVVAGLVTSVAAVFAVLYVVTLVVARDRALEAERTAQQSALEQQVAFAQLRAETGMPGIAREDLAVARIRAQQLGFDARPAELAASGLDLAFPPPEIVTSTEGLLLLHGTQDRLGWLSETRELTIHDLISGAVLHRTRIPGTGILQLSLAADGSFRALNFDRGRVQRFDGNTGTLQWEMQVPEPPAGSRGFRLSADETVLAVNQAGNTSFYEVPSGTEIGAIEGWIQQMSHDGSRAMLAVQEGGPHRQIERVRLVDVRQGTTLGELVGADRYALTDDLSMAVRGGGEGLEALDWTGTRLWTTASEPVAAIPASNERVAVIGESGRLEVRDLRTGTIEVSKPLGLPPAPDSASLQFGSGWVAAEDRQQFRVWSLTEPTQQWETHAGAALAVAVSPDGNLAATTGWEGDLAVWDWRSRRELLRYRISDRGVRDAAFSSDGTRIATADREGHVRVVDLVQGTLGPVLKADHGIAMAVHWRTSGALVAAYEDGTLLEWDVDRGKPGRNLRADLTTIWAMDGVGDRVIVSGRDGSDPAGELWDLAAGTRVAVTQEDTIGYGAALSSDGTRWAIGRADGAVIVGDDSQQRVLDLSVQRGPAMSVAWVGDLLAVGCFDGRLVLLDPDTGTELHTVQTQPAAVISAAAVPGTKTLLLTGNEPGTVTVFDLGRTARIEATALHLVPGEDRQPDWLAAAERAELRADWRHAVVALEAAVAQGASVDPIRLVRARAGSGDLRGAALALDDTKVSAGTAAAWTPTLEAP